jgi:hypothetical protein
VGLYVRAHQYEQAMRRKIRVLIEAEMTYIRTPIGEIAYHNSPKLKLKVKGLKTLLPDASQRPAPVGLPYL